MLSGGGGEAVRTCAAKKETKKKSKGAEAISSKCKQIVIWVLTVFFGRKKLIETIEEQTHDQVDGIRW